MGRSSSKISQPAKHKYHQQQSQLKKISRKQFDSDVGLCKIEDYDYQFFKSDEIATFEGITHLKFHYVHNNALQNTGALVATIAKNCKRLKEITIQRNSYQSILLIRELQRHSLSLTIQRVNAKSQSFQVIKTIIKAFRHLKIIQIDRIETQYLAQFASKSKNLIAVHIKSIQSQSIENHQANIKEIHKMKNLNSLGLCLNFTNIPKKVFTSLLQLPETIQQLSIQIEDTSSRVEYSEQFIQTLNQLEQLKSLKIIINHRYNIKCNSIKLLKTKLKSLYLRQIQCRNHVLIQLFANNKQIQDLSLIRCQIYDCPFLRIQSLPLKSFYFSIGPQFIQDLCLYLPNLQKLTLSRCSNIQQKAFKYISTLSQLQQLKIEDLCQMTNKSAIYLRKLRKLKKLLVNECFNLTSSSFTTLIINLKNLPFYQCSEKYQLINDKYKREKMVQNINKATKTWIRFIKNPDENLVRYRMVID